MLKMYQNAESSGLGRQQYLKFHEILKYKKNLMWLNFYFPAENLIHNNYKAMRLLHSNKWKTFYNVILLKFTPENSFLHG